MKNHLLPVAILFSLLSLLPFSNFAQAPNLGTAVNFVLFSSNGAVTNSGISQLTGNVGTNSGSSTGFGNVNGGMHDNDGTSGACASDLLIAYNQLNSRIPTFFPAPLLGNGDTLVAGVYKISAVTTLSGMLILDARGDSNAVFIFQIQAAFSSNTSSKVVLINGAQACNVFWKVEGLVSIASSTFMRGTIIANNAAINLTTNDTLEGRALSTTGAISVDGVLAYTPIGCGSVVLTGPAAPNLASAACYAIFSGNGSVTNAGVTHVTGDVGTNVGLTSGYNPLFVNGIVHPIPDGSTAACAANLLNAYNYLNVLPADIELLYPAQFGNNLVLTPHTYIMNAATSFTGTVILNAQGVANAVFVIKIYGALSTSTFSKVKLINGAQAKNVYWMINGAVTLNDFSVFNGTIICNNGALNLNTGDTINGRALTTNGALSTNAIVANNPSGSCGGLPVTWLYFRGSPVQKNVVLEWATTNQINSGFFTIEKSTNGTNFQRFSTVVAGSTPALNGEYYYSIKDLQPDDVNYYRISETDLNGQQKYFQTIEVRMPRQGLKVTTLNNGGIINLQVSGGEDGNGVLDLYSMDGKLIISKMVVLSRNTSNYTLPAPEQKGIYIINLNNRSGIIYRTKIIQQ